MSWTQLTSGASASGTLIVLQGGHSADITLLGQYATRNFSTFSDGHGGTGRLRCAHRLNDLHFGK